MDEVAGEDVHHRLRGQILDAVEVSDAAKHGVVEQDVDPAPLLEHPFRQRHDRLAVHQIQRDDQRAPAAFLDLLRGAFEAAGDSKVAVLAYRIRLCDALSLFDRARADHDIEAGLGEGECAGPADAAARPGDDRYWCVGHFAPSLARCQYRPDTNPALMRTRQSPPRLRGPRPTGRSPAGAAPSGVRRSGVVSRE